jgi:uncharacterized protein YbjT (DUF2867 family)
MRRPRRSGTLGFTENPEANVKPTKERNTMKIVVIGGSGLIGSKVVACLRDEGHDAVAASPSSGVNSYTGEGLPEVLDGASVVVDVTNSPSFEDDAVMDFFTTSTANLVTAERDTGVGHHVALSIVGTDGVPDSGYLRAKVAQEKLLANSGIPYTIVRATQFFEFVTRIADEATDGDTVRVPPVLIQPMAADDVAAAVCEVSQRPPVDGIVETGGPEVFAFEEFIRRGLEAKGDPRTVVTDPTARYFGAELDERALVAGDGAHLGEIRLNDWLAQLTAPETPPRPG